MNYSYLSASVGFSCDARFAGSMPKISPTAQDTVKAITIDASETGMRTLSTNSCTLSGIETPDQDPEDAAAPG